MSESSEIMCKIVKIASINKTLYDSLFFYAPTQEEEIASFMQRSDTDIFYIRKGEIKILTIEIKPPEVKNNDDVIIFSHGLLTNISYYFDMALKISYTHKIKFVLYEYIGYSPSKPELKGEKYMYLTHELVNLYYKDLNRYLVGYSIGTSVVVDYAYRHPHDNDKKILLLAPFKNFPSVVCKNDSDKLNVEAFDIYSKIDKIKNPILICHGKCDDIIPCNHAEELYNCLFNKTFNLVLEENLNHSTILDKLCDFIFNFVESK